MTVITCGRTNLGNRAEAITRVLREEHGFRTDGGCGQTFDLDHPIQHMRVSRCLECWRWLCEPCIRAHFEESQHDEAARSQPAIAQPEQEAHTAERPDMAVPSAPVPPANRRQAGGRGTTA